MTALSARNFRLVLSRAEIANLCGILLGNARFKIEETAARLIKRPAPIVSELEGSYGVHHAFMVAPDAYRAAVDNLRANGVEIFLEEDRQGGVIDGPRAYFRDPDGTALEFIHRTAYTGDK